MDSNKYVAEFLVSLLLVICLSVNAQSISELCIIFYLIIGLSTEVVACSQSIQLLKVRQNAAPGFWLTCLLPVMLLNKEDDATGEELAFVSLIIFIMHVLSRSFSFYTYPLFCLLMIPCCIKFYLNWLSGFIFVLMLILSQQVIQSFSNSLTIGESLLISQLLFTFLICAPVFIIPFILGYITERFKMKFSLISGWNLLFIGFCMFLFLNFLNEEELVDKISLDFTWLIKLINVKNVLLLFIWTPLSILAIEVVIYFSYINSNTYYSFSFKPPNNLETSNLNYLNSPNCFDQIQLGKSPLALRKFFHLLAGLVYTSGLLISPHFLSTAAVGVLVIFLLVEWARRTASPPISSVLNYALQPFRDSRDNGQLIFTPIALILGISLPVWGIETFEQHKLFSTLDYIVKPSAWIGVITICLGDSVAALVGRQWGENCKWPYTHRTIIGSVSSLIVQLIMWSALVYIYEWSWKQGCFPLVAGVLTEAYTEQIDNLAIPLFVMTLFNFA